MFLDPALALFFATFDFCKHQFERNHLSLYSTYPNFLNFCFGVIAETVSCILWVPIDVVKERLQVQNELKIQNYKNPIDAVRQIMQRESVFGLYKSQGATILSFGPFSGIMFIVIELLKKKLEQNKSNLLSKNFWSGVVSACVASIVTNPLEISKTRMQVVRQSRQTNVESLFP